MSAARPRIPYISIGIFAAIMLVVCGYVAMRWPTLRLLADPNRFGTQHEIVSESMLPTLQSGERVAPLRIPAASLRRGMIVLFRLPDHDRVGRIAAVGGDTVEVRHGILIIDGVVVPQRRVGRGPVLDDDSGTSVWAERLPGENHWHRLLDAGVTALDDVGAVTVPPGALFVLGDNRDRIADSRLAVDEGGAGMVPEASVIGWVDTVSWSPRSWRIGAPVDASASR